jgi:hypothetical protein
LLQNRHLAPLTPDKITAVGQATVCARSVRLFTHFELVSLFICSKLNPSSSSTQPSLTAMSGGKIKSKDLSYDSSLPPFLQRLRAQNTGYGDDGDPDRHERPLARPKRAKNPDDDDGPTFVDESGETVTKEDYEKQLRGDAEGEEDAGNVTGELKGDGKPEASGALPGPRVEQKLTDGTAVKKRKMAKVVGEDEEDGLQTGGVDKGTTQKAPKKAKKKAKPIKLAFDDDEG